MAIIYERGVSFIRLYNLIFLVVSACDVFVNTTFDINTESKMHFQYFFVYIDNDLAIFVRNSLIATYNA